jgi:NTE family protein
VNWTAERIYRVRRDVLKERLTANNDPVYWDIEGSIDQFQARNVLDCDPEVTRTAAAAGSDLSGIEEPLQDALIDWGYALADAAIRSRMSESLSVKPPAASPKGVFYCQPKKSSMGAA